jgi:hypothetical protein
MRWRARLLNVDLWRQDDAVLGQYANALFRNPLAIRWFVQSYSEGRPLGDLIEKRRSLHEVLDFCFHTLYVGLEESHKQLLRTLVAIGQPLSEVQLALLSGLPSLEQVKSATAFLYSSNLLTQNRDDWGSGVASLWMVSEFARAYITARDKGLLASRPKAVREYRALRSSRDKSRLAVSMNPFRTSAFAASTTDEATVVALLRTANKQVRAPDAKAAMVTIERAKALLPFYFEVWRVSAQVRDAAGDAMGANSDYQHAVDLADGRSAPLLVHYANFLLGHDDPDTATEVLQAAAADPEADPRLVGALGRAAFAAGELEASLGAFRRSRDGMDSLGGLERQILVHDFCRALLTAADQETQRRFPGRALALALEALDAVASCRDTAVDVPFVQVAQSVVDRSCRLAARSCDTDEWESVARRIALIRPWIAVMGAHHPGIDQLARSCPSIATESSFLDSFGPDAARPLTLFGEVITPKVDADYTFIRGDDGRDYFLHASELGRGTWSDIGRHGNSRVRFTPGTATGDKAPPARAVEVISFDLD